jgi:5-hydroxyisourate hydrolase
MSSITTHVLDTAKGCPASGIPVKLAFKQGETWKEIGQGVTNNDGRIVDLVPKGTNLAIGTYQLTFETGVYFSATGSAAFYPSVPVLFQIDEADQHYHVPLLLSPFGYSTYRGS